MIFEFLVSILWFIIFIKSFFFWLWLWQLKEYHLGRLKAHFEAQKFKKFISSFWRLKFPKFTKKIILISFSSILLQLLMLFYLPLFLVIILTILFFPLFVLSFQIPTFLWRKIIIKKATKKREKFKNLKVIGITGSYGKTSTKEFLATILSEKFKVLKTREHQNSEIGISRCILNELRPEHQVFVVEMGAYNKGGIKLLCNIVKPQIGMITGINEQHLATFGTMENLLSAEGGKELIESLPKEGIVFFNGKNKYCLEIYQKTKIKKKLYGQDAPLCLENLEGAKAVAKELGLSEEEILRGVEKIENKFPGIQLKKGINGLNIIDATYSANPDSIMAHLEYLKTFSGKKIIIMPCLIELGQASKEVHRRIGRKISEVCDLAIVTTKDRLKEIKETAPHVLFIEKSEEILKKIKEFCQPGDVILLESRLPNKVIEFLIL